MTIPQIGGMYAGDRARKENLVSNGFRLPSAMDNRPMKFDEFESKMKQVVYVSATPGKYEIEKSCDPKKQKHDFFKFHPLTDGVWSADEYTRVIPQMIRPTGLLDPEIELKPMEHMVDDIMQTLKMVIEK